MPGARGSPARGTPIGRVRAPRAALGARRPPLCLREPSDPGGWRGLPGTRGQQPPVATSISATAVPRPPSSPASLRHLPRSPAAASRGGNRSGLRPASAAAHGERRERGAGEEAARELRSIHDRKDRRRPPPGRLGDTHPGSGWGWVGVPPPGPWAAGNPPLAEPTGAPSPSTRRRGRNKRDPPPATHMGIRGRRSVRFGRLPDTPSAPERRLSPKAERGKKEREKERIPPEGIGRSDAAHFTFGSLTSNRENPAGPRAPRPGPALSAGGPKEPSSPRGTPPRVPGAGRTLSGPPAAPGGWGGRRANHAGSNFPTCGAAPAPRPGAAGGAETPAWRPPPLGPRHLHSPPPPACTSLPHHL